jgi:serine/threonine protein kinase
MLTTTPQHPTPLPHTHSSPYYSPEEVLLHRHPWVILNRSLNETKIRVAFNLDLPDPPRSYAVKQIWKYPLNENQWQNLKRGIGIHQYLSGEYGNGVVRLEEVIEDDCYLYLVMEALDGDLVSMLEHKRTALVEEDAREIFKQTVNIVEFMHGKNIVHRDLKLDNMMICWDSPVKKSKVVNVKLGDFDMADYEKDGESFEVACGSPPYAAPELTELNPVYDGKKADIWAVGVLLYVLVCGCFPWQDSDLYTLFQKIKKDPLHLPSHLSPEVKDLLSQLLNKDPSNRITIPNILNHSWYKYSNLSDVN